MSLDGQPHPMYIPSVVSQIMSYLPVADLLRARHVCPQWNEEASKYLRHQVKLKICQSKDISQVCDVIKSSHNMFKFPLKFHKVHMEAGLSSAACKSQSFQLFFKEFAPELKSLSIKQSWESQFPLNRLPQLEELSIYGNLNKEFGIFPTDDIPYLPSLKRAYFYLEGRITDTNALVIFASNISTLLSAAPNLEEIVAPKKIDHRDETAYSYRNDTPNHIFLHVLAADHTPKLVLLRVLRIDAKLMDTELEMLRRSAPSLPKLDTLGIALSGAATRTKVVAVLQSFSRKLKDLSIAYSKTHGSRQCLESFFHQDSPLPELETLSLKNYPTSVSFLGVIKQLKTFTIEVRHIDECFDKDRDDFFRQPIPYLLEDSPPSVVKSSGPARKKSRKSPPPPVDPTKTHGLSSFHYIHNKEGTQINLFRDRGTFVVTRRICMRFPQLTCLTLDNMSGDCLSCVLRYLPLLEELVAVGGFYNDLSVVGADSWEELLSSDFPAKRKLPYIGDLKNLRVLTLSTFSMDSMLFDKNDLLSDNSVYYGIIDCKKLRRLTLGSDLRGNPVMRSKFETRIGDQAISALIDDLNLIYLKTVRCPIPSQGFPKILKRLKERGVEYSINDYEGPILPEEFHRMTRQAKPVVRLERLTIPASSSSAKASGSSPSNSNSSSSSREYCLRNRQRTEENVSPTDQMSIPIPTVKSNNNKVKRRRKRRFGTYKF